MKFTFVVSHKDCIKACWDDLSTRVLLIRLDMHTIDDLRLFEITVCRELDLVINGYTGEWDVCVMSEIS